jgi:hypothetical protein
VDGSLVGCPVGLGAAVGDAVKKKTPCFIIKVGLLVGILVVMAFVNASNSAKLKKKIVFFMAIFVKETRLTLHAGSHSFFSIASDYSCCVILLLNQNQLNAVCC